MKEEELDPKLINSPREFWETVDFLRKQRGLSLRKLGQITEVPFSTIHGYFRGTSRPRPTSGHEVGRIIRAVGVPEPEAPAWVSAHQRLHGIVLPERDRPQWPAPPTRLRPPVEQLDREPRLRGRGDLLADLQSRLLGRPPDLGAPRVHVLHGLSGTGKSAVALNLAKQAMAKRVTTWWVRGGDPDVFTADMYALAVDLGVSAQRLNPGSAIDAVWQVLENRRPWLLIIDGLNDPQPVLASEGRPVGDAVGWLRPVRGPHGAVLITSQNGGAEVWQTGDPGITPHGRPWITLHRIPTLTASDGADILSDLAGARAGSRAEAVELAERLGGLPLALKQAGLHLVRAHRTPAPLVSPGTARTYAEYQSALDEGRYPDLFSTWEFSLDLLTRQQLPEARQLLTLLACLGPDTVPYDLLQPETLASSDLFPDLEGGWLWDLLRALDDLGLVDLSDEKGVRLHPMVYATTRRHPGIGVDHLRLVTALLNTAAHADPRDPEHWTRWRALVPHSTAPLDLVDLLGEPVDVPALLRPLLLAARFLRASGQLEQAARILRSGLERARSLFGPDHPDVLAVEHDLARVVYGLGHWSEAETLLRRVLETRLRVLGADSHDVLTSRHYLGRVMHDLGRTAEAEALFERTLEDRRRLLGSGHRDTLTTMNNLAVVRLDRGQTGQAEEILSEVLSRRTDLLGADHPATLITRYHLAVLYRRTGQLDAAEHALRSLCDDSRRVQGSAHPRTLAARRLLAEVLVDSDHRSEATDLLSHVLLGQSETLGDQHPATVRTRAILTGLTAP